MNPHAPPDGDIALADDLLVNLNRLSGWIAHEVNNPVAGIQNAFALLRPLIPADHPHAHFADDIGREIARLAALTQRVQKAYDYEDGRGRPIPFASAISEAAGLLDQLCRVRGTPFVLDIDRDAGSVKVSGRLALAAIRHLLQHAVESAPPGPIPVRAWRGNDRLWLAVPEHQPTNPPGPRAAAGPNGLALTIVLRVLAPLSGELVLAPNDDGVREIIVGLPVPTATLAAS